MEALTVHSIADKGNLEKECVWLQANADIADLSYYLLIDTTYTDDHVVSNELRHVYWFSRQAVKKGEWVRLMTKSGTNGTVKSNQGTPIHTYYWKLGKTVWNQDGDAAVLFSLKTWNITRAPAK